MAQHDYTIANQGFPATRQDLNNVLDAIRTNNSGTSAPLEQYAGQFWLDTTSSNWVLYIHDGADDIQFATIDTSANTVNFTDSALDVVTDTTPQLGGNLDLNSNDITGTGNINITGTGTFSGDLTVDTNTLFVDASENTVVVGGTDATSWNTNADELVVAGASAGGMTFYNPTQTNIFFADGTSGDDVSRGRIQYTHTNNALIFGTNASERMRITSSGIVLVGKTATDLGTAGTEIQSSGRIDATRNGGVTALFNRLTSTGDIVQFKKDGTTIGSIGAKSNSSIYIDSKGSNQSGIEFDGDTIVPRRNGAVADNQVNLGYSGTKFKDITLGGGLYVGGTGTANKLDDYEEGTWSPSIQASGNHFSSRTHGDRIGYYTKVGRLVTAHFRVNCTAVTVGSASGALQVESLPFTASNLNTNLSHAGSLYSMDNINFDPAGTFGTANIGLRTNANDNKGTIKIVRNNGASAGVAAATAINSNSEIEGVLIYFTD